MAEIKKRGYIPRLRQTDETRIRIAFCMYNYGEPMTMAEISKRTHVVSQSVAYHLPILIRDGIVLCKERSGIKFYLLQPFFYDSGLMESIFQAFVPIVDFVGGNLAGSEDESDYSQAEIGTEEAVVNNIRTLLYFFSIKLDNVVEQTDEIS